MERELYSIEQARAIAAFIAESSTTDGPEGGGGGGRGAGGAGEVGVAAAALIPRGSVRSRLRAAPHDPWAGESSLPARSRVGGGRFP